MSNLEIFLPLTLLILAFLLKLSIDRNIETPNIIQALCELPVDMIFLAISFLIAFTISTPDNPSEGLFYSFSFIVIAVIVVALWRKSLKLFENNNKFWILLLVINMVISTLSIFQSTTTLLKKKGNITENVKEK